MAMPPFPSQDLAKLVLGYLAEEELMTAYDEFLQSSPYLDALSNEYDRIFMTSLKTILAEYRALKIYVATCRPVGIRKRLSGCANLLEVVKCLIQNVDVNKLSVQQTNTVRLSFETANSTHLSSAIEMSNSLKLPSCVCKTRSTADGGNVQTSCSEPTSESPIETTALEDLPGNHNTVRKNHVKGLEKDSAVSLSNSSSEQNMESCLNKEPEGVSVSSLSQNVTSDNSQTQGNTTSQSVQHIPMESHAQRKMEVFDNLNDNNSVTDNRCDSNFSAEAVEHTRMSTAGTFQDFARNVQGGDGPDSSTSENVNVQMPVTKEISIDTQEVIPCNKNLRGVTKRLLLRVDNVRNNSDPQISDADKISNNSSFRHAGILRPKTVEQKVTILSDVKVDKTFKHSESNQMPQISKNATSTPLMQMQSIRINGTPAYNQDPKIARICSYTKDEIMAMPTIILVSSSAPSLNPVSIQSQGVTSKTVSQPTTTSSTARALEPLLIDVSTSGIASGKINTAINNVPLPNAQTEDTSNEMLIKTTQTRNVTEPKDNLETSNKSTPHALPPTRKSSSTPRRISHVRVLDFTTPRRILQETINEHALEHNSSPVETVISKSPNLHTFVHPSCADNTSVVSEQSLLTRVESSDSSSCSKENITHTALSTKKNNWDADLRALAVANPTNNNTKLLANPKPKPRKSKKKKLSLSETKGPETDASAHKKTDYWRQSSVKKKTGKNKTAEPVVTSEEVVVISDDATVAGIKPTINIITRSDWGPSSGKDNNEMIEKSHNKSNEVEIETPEMDRISLHNEIGAKLNISDFLETPYKQAMYDIQMETPRFLGPDIPGEPLSDIKIMNIPTPRFLNTPKPVQATPSSYSSRPTDYSSGGSYYKPEDQDYLRIDDSEYPVTSTENPKLPSVDPPTVSECDNKNKTGRSSRPVRKCTKNVSYSYYSSPIVNNKTRETDDKAEIASSCSETISVNSLGDYKIEKETSKHIKEKSAKSQNKGESKKKTITSKKRKTPVKKESSRIFMKIKPRRATPTKGVGKTKRKSSDLHVRKRTSSKDKTDNITSVASVPTKSRRKSSTPRKLHKTFHSESSGHDSPDLIAKKKQIVTRESTVACAQESDTEQLPLRWSDDGSQDAKSREQQVTSFANDTDDISKIQEYIAKSEQSKQIITEKESNLHVDLVKRGFDIETAKIIERDLLDTPPISRDDTTKSTVVKIVMNKNETPLEGHTQSIGNVPTSLPTEEEEEECDDIELSIHDCNEDTSNYITCQYDDTIEVRKPTSPLPKLKDKFSMEVCIDDGPPIRLRATPFSVLLDQDIHDVETEVAVNSISNIDKLYTPMKDFVKAQCYEIFDSTLTSLDTPLKARSPKRKEHEMTVTEIVLEVEKVEDKEKVEVREKVEVKKRKRLQSGNASDDSLSESKRAKPEPQYLLNSANIQNIDIETVLYKLHGP